MPYTPEQSMYSAQKEAPDYAGGSEACTGSQPSQSMEGMMMLVLLRNSNKPRKETSILRSVYYLTHSSWSIVTQGSKNFGAQEDWIKLISKDMPWRYLGGLPPVKHAGKQIPVTSWPRHARKRKCFPLVKGRLIKLVKGKLQMALHLPVAFYLLRELQCSKKILQTGKSQYWLETGLYVSLCLRFIQSLLTNT